MRFIHCADLHLDSPLRGLERYEGAPAQDMREATRRSFTNVIDLALEREVDFVLIAGDIFDGDWLDFNTGLFFANQLRRLADADVRAFIVRGNHDALSKISKAVTLPKNVHVFKSNKPTTILDENLGFAIHGQSFATGVVTDDLAAQYPDVHSGLLNIGLLHTALAGREGHESYAPTTPERLIGKGYHYWALGHVHTRETVRQNPWIVFPGNTQGRHAREVGPKGCVVVEGDADEGIRSVEFVATDVARWQHLTLDATDVANLDDLQAAVQQAVRGAVLESGDRLLALRISVGGRTPLHGKLAGSPESFRAEACAWLNEASGGTAWLEKIKLSVSAPMDLAALATRDDPFGILLRRLDELAADPEGLARLAESALSELEQKIPAELRERDALLKPLSEEVRAEALASARERLLAAISLEGSQ
ncbi:MAG: DNA repair exonuclease [Sulfuricella sp.]|nr:DNA repair exonuclease [Sulfuricella sp.]